MDNYEALIPTIHSILKKLNVYHKRDDYIDLCWIGYTKALNNYEEQKGSFKTYAYKCMKNEVLKELRKEIAKKRPHDIVSLDEYDFTIEQVTALETPSKCEIQSELIKEEENKELYEAIGKLSAREQDIFTNLWKLRTVNLSRRQLADKYDISPTQISNINGKAFKKIKEVLNG